MYHNIPEEGKGDARAFHSMLEAIENVKVDKIVNDKDIFNWCG